MRASSLVVLFLLGCATTSETPKRPTLYQIQMEPETTTPGPTMCGTGDVAYLHLYFESDQEPTVLLMNSRVTEGKNSNTWRGIYIPTIVSSEGIIIRVPLFEPFSPLTEEGVTWETLFIAPTGGSLYFTVLDGAENLTQECKKK